MLGVTVAVLLFCLVRTGEGSVGLPSIWQGCGGRGIRTVLVKATVSRCSFSLSWVAFGDEMHTRIPVTQRIMKFGSRCW